MNGLTPIIAITILLLIVAIAIILLVFVYQQKQLQYYNEKTQLKAAFEKEILESRLDIQEQTMKYLSQEIHDNIGQVLSLVKLNINSMRTIAPGQLEGRIDDTVLLLSQSIKDLRDLAKSMHADILNENGLIKSVENQLAFINKTGRYHIVFHQQCSECSFSRQEELILFRLFQEILNNIIKHSKASSILVDMCYQDTFTFKIIDDGIGFDAAKTIANSTSGLGIRNMQNRANLIGANLDIQTLPGKGTTVKIELPISNRTVK